MILNKFLKCISLVLLAYSIASAKSANILGIFSFGGKSHFMMTNALIKALIQRGHQITMVTARSLNHLKLGANYTEILIDPPYNYWEDVKQAYNANSLFELANPNFIDIVGMPAFVGLKITEYALRQPKVQGIINAKQTDRVYDLLLIQQFYQEAFLALAYKYNIPIISMNTMNYENYMSQMVGIIFPWSFVPHNYAVLTDRMTFKERMMNTLYCLYDDFYREFLYFPQMDKLVEQHFSHLPVKIPKVTEMEKNISAILINGYIPLTSVRPKSDVLIPVGGIHMSPLKPLPSDIKTYLDGAAEHGAIFFSLGSNLQSKDMSPEKLKIFLNVFAGLKQRILWKYEDETIPNLPANVMIREWLPQNDILAHPNVRVFITHGGLFSTQEGLYHGVPMLGIPCYSDQSSNMRKLAQAGYAISLHFHSITRDMLRKSLDKLLNDATYRENVQRLSHIFRDRPMEARETAIYWIEYVIRHEGAPHLRSAGVDLPWYQFYLLDVIGFCIGCAFVVLTGLYVVMRLMLRRIYKFKSHRQIKKEKPQ